MVKGIVANLAIGVGRSLYAWRGSLEQALWQMRLGGLGKHSYIYPDVHIVGPGNVFIGDEVKIWHRAFINAPGGQVVIGKGAHVGVMAYINAAQGKVIIGDNVSIAPMAQIYSYSDQLPEASGNPREHKVADVVIGDNAWLGAGVIVLPGVTIGRNVVVGAGSVVNKDLEDNTVYGGVPSRRLRPLVPEDTPPTDFNVG